MDLRVERTYRSLSNEFMRLMTQKSFEDISVAELCKGAMIRRTTFYKHFADKNEFLIFFMHEVRDDFARQIEHKSNKDEDAIENSVNMLRQTLKFLSAHGDLVDNALSSQSAPMLLDAMGDVMMVDMTRRLKEEAAKRDASLNSPGKTAGFGTCDPEMLATFITGGLVKMLRAWCEAGRPAEMEQRMVDMVRAARGMLT